MRSNRALYGGFAVVCAILSFGLPLLANENALPLVTYIQVMVCGLLLARIADKLGA
jgi:hypothetical protein